MATLTQTNLTLSEQMKQIGPGGNLLEIVNVMALYNEMNIDAVWQMANDMFADVSSKVIKMPSIGTRRINRGSAGGVGRTAQHREFIEILESRPYIDMLLLKGQPDGGAQARLNQIRLFIEATAQTMADHLLYGSNATDPEMIDGFLTRLYDSSLTNVTKMGGSGTDTTSLLVVEWDSARCCLIYPRAVPHSGGTEAMGISEVDNGKQRITDDDGNAFDALESVIQSAFGIKLLDDRNVARLVNIESSGVDNTMFATSKMHELIRAVNNMTGKGRDTVIYCNVDVKTQFDIYAMDKLGGLTVSKDAFGQPITMFQNRIPIRLMESMSSTETAIA